MNKTNQDFIKKIELELLRNLFDYVVPFLNRKIDFETAKKPKQTKYGLENIVNSKPKIDFKDVKELEALLLRNLNENVKIGKNISINSNNLFYSLNLRRQKDNKEKQNNYSISIKYEENQSEEKLKISVQQNQKEQYQAEITEQKNKKDKVAPYSVIIDYEDSYAEERLTITYKQQLRGYMQRHIESREDTSSRVPLKWLNILPESQMGGILGFTYLGDTSMGRRADLTGKTARMVDIHESIHTPDEYETRVLTSWIMEKARSKYVK